MYYLPDFNRAMSYEDYISMLGENLALHQLHYKKFDLPTEIAAELVKIPELKILVITEPWCGDSLALLPVIKKISEVAENWQIRVTLRDKNKDLIDQFLTNGSRAIPIFLFLSRDGYLLFSWGPRPAVAAEIYDAHRAAISNGTIDKQRVLKKIRTFYAKDRGLLTLTEIVNLLRKKNEWYFNPEILSTK